MINRPLARVCMGGFVVGVVIWAALGIWPETVEYLPRPFAAFANPSAWWPILAEVLLGASGVLLFRRRSVDGTEKVGPAVVMALAITTGVLGLSSYWHCAGNESPVWSPLAWTLGLFVGNTADPFTGSGSCPSGIPLSLQAARLAALVLITVLAQQAFFALFSEQVDRARARRSSGLVAIVGGDADTGPLLRVIRDRLPSGQRMVIFGVDEASRDLARQVGALYLTVDPFDDSQVLGAASRRGICALSGLYLLSPDATLNIELADRFRHVLSGAKKRRSEVPGRLVVRIDDPWQAEDWRRRNLGSGEMRWLYDAVNPYQMAARAALECLRPSEPHTIVAVGGSAFTIALLDELTLRRREQATRLRHLQAPLPLIYLVGSKASETLARFDEQQERYGDTGMQNMIHVVEGKFDDVATRLMASGRGTALVLGSEDGPTGLMGASQIAARHSAWTIVAWDPTSSARSRLPVMGNLYLVGRVLEPECGEPLDLWEWFGRVLHQRYLDAWFGGVPVAGDSARGAWNGDLSPFIKDSNIRQVANIMAFVRDLGWEWSAACDQSESFPPEIALDAGDSDAAARAEHESWVRHHEENGWRLGPTRDAPRRFHPALVPWTELPKELRADTIDGVASLLKILGQLGFSVHRSGQKRDQRVPNQSQWQTFARSGVVRASLLTTPRTWHTPRGQSLRGLAGDWLVTASDGSSHTVADAAFRRSYRHVQGDEFERMGLVLARRVKADVAIATLEGFALAEPGDWVVTGTGGEQWPVTNDIFCDLYKEPALPSG